MMGFVFKSAIGLGAVYFAMFSSAPQALDLGPAAALCTAAAKSRLSGDGFRAQWAAAGCGASIVSVAAKAAALPSFPPPAAPPAAPPPAAKPVAGTLTEADLREPWFGPGRLSRKGAKRG